ncbi:hypothetical protein LCM20_08735 [Halobacillus litoralis]|uniref:hypothetical protein n=1 Tax=Halobacillus litoralis TaxID=45668 RepID=UPI001CD78493|nr:hypothetical protein [Halobacillus litoralis]MCA0970671.1 hypothetical protein [Halobacillus litoralis]
MKEKILFYISVCGNFLLFYHLLNPVFNRLFYGSAFSIILWIVLMLTLTFGTSIYTFRYLKRSAQT